MTKVKSLDDLHKMRKELHSQIIIRENSNNPESLPQIKVSMGTCGIASGAKEVMAEFFQVLNAEKADAVVTQTGCMGYCDSEPVVEVTLPDREPVIYGNVTAGRVAEIVRKHILGGTPVEGILPAKPRQ